MIQYALKCEAGHRTESWFKSADAFDALARSGHLSCAVCGSADVRKAPMSPRVSHGEKESGSKSGAPMIRNPSHEVEQAIGALRRKVEATSDYVGTAFAAEARAMHSGEKPERSIYGEARTDQARELIEEGVPLLPLPFRPKRKLS